MDDLKLLAQISKLFLKTRNKYGFTLDKVSKDTNIPIRILKELESFDKEYFLSNKILYIRYCHYYKDYLKLSSELIFDKISENTLMEKENIIDCKDGSRNPTINHIEISILILVFIFSYLFYSDNKREAQIKNAVGEENLIFIN